MTNIIKTKPKKRIRDAEATQKNILQAAKTEFAQNGLGGARVDVIAERSGANKRMIYHYFNSKQELFKRVLEDAYIDIRQAALSLELEHLDPETALETLIRFTWQYYIDNPEFIRLVNSENLHKARHLKGSDIVRSISASFIGVMSNLLKRGADQGVFRHDIDPLQLNITIAAIGFYYLTNRYTGSIIFQRDFMAQDALEARLRFNIDTIMRLVRI